MLSREGLIFVLLGFMVLCASASSVDPGCTVGNGTDSKTFPSPQMLAITSVRAAGEDELVAIANTGTEPQSLQGWTLEINDGRNGSIALPGLTLHPDDKVNIHLGHGGNNGTDIFLSTSITLVDALGNITLKDRSGMSVASYGYRVQPDGSVTGTMIAEGDMPSSRDDTNPVTGEAGGAPYVAEETGYAPQAGEIGAGMCL